MNIIEQNKKNFIAAYQVYQSFRKQEETKVLKTDTKEIQSFLTMAYMLYERHEVVEDTQCFGFNIFSILNMEKREVETHSNFIYELLNTKGSHRQKTVFLKIFLENVLKFNACKNLETAIVKREDPTSKGKRIDFTIETDEYLIAIEMKVDENTDDQKNQLIDYHDEIIKRNKASNKDKDIRIYYLTLNGKSATTKSIGENSETEVSRIYKKLSFKEDILNWINLCIKEVPVTPVVRELLHQYKILIGKITDQDHNLKNSIQELISKYPSISSQVAKSFETTAVNLETNFWTDLVKKVNENNIKGFIGTGREITKETVLYARNIPRGEHSEINIYFNICKLDEQNNIVLKVGFDNTNEDIYVTVYKELNDKWTSGHSDKRIIVALEDSPVNFRKFSWAYGFAILDTGIQLRNENLYEIKDEDKIKYLVELITELVPKVRYSVVKSIQKS